MSAAPTVAVVVVNWNGADVLPSCLDSLERTGVLGRPDVEVVLVDNASTDGSADAAAVRHPGLVVLRRPENAGFAAGVNTAVATVDADVVVLLNNDAEVEDGWLDALLAPLVEAPDVGAVTGRVVLAGRWSPAPPDDPTALVAADGGRWRRADATGGSLLLNSTGNEVTLSGNGRDRDWLRPLDDGPAPTTVFGLNGGNAALRRAALDAVGVLDPSLFMYYEDTDLSWRLRRGGWQVVHAHDAVTVHRHASSSGTRTAFFHVHNARNRLVVALRHAPWPVVARAWARTLARAARGPDRGRTVRALAEACARVPAELSVRRAVDRAAVVGRARVAQLLVPDGPTAGNGSVRP